MHFSDSLRQIANQYVEYSRKMELDRCYDELYSPFAESVEAADIGEPPEGVDCHAKGLAAIRRKADWFLSNFGVEVKSVEGPFYHGEDRFGVVFHYDVEHKASQEQFTEKELAFFTVRDGRIVHEEFYYHL